MHFRLTHFGYLRDHFRKRIFSNVPTLKNSTNLGFCKAFQYIRPIEDFCATHRFKWDANGFQGTHDSRCISLWINPQQWRTGSSDKNFDSFGHTCNFKGWNYICTCWPFFVISNAFLLLCESTYYPTPGFSDVCVQVTGF